MTEDSIIEIIEDGKAPRRSAMMMRDAIIEEARAKGWEMRSHGNAYGNAYNAYAGRQRPRYFHLYSPKGDWVFGVSIPPCSDFLTWEQIIAMAWDELLKWIDPAKLRRLVS